MALDILYSRKEHVAMLVAMLTSNPCENVLKILGLLNNFSVYMISSYVHVMPHHFSFSHFFAL